MKKLFYVAAIVPAVALATFAFFGGQSHVSHAQTNATETFHLVLHDTADTYLDFGPKGPSRGDQYVSEDPVFDATNSNQVGEIGGTCTIIDAKKGYNECAFTVYLQDGQINVMGPIGNNGDTELAIIGGTGKYRDAFGTMKIHQNGNDDDYYFNIG